MGLSTDNIVNQSTGTFTATSGSATLPATTAGNSVLIVAGLGGDGSTLLSMPNPSGFSPIVTWGQSFDRTRVHAWVKTTVSEGETSWTLTINEAAQTVVWAAFEISNLDLDFPTKAYLTSNVLPTSSTVASIATGETATGESFSALGLALFMAGSTDTTVPTISGFTGGYFEQATQDAAVSPRAYRLSVAATNILAVGTQEATASLSPNSYANAVVLVFTGVDSRHAPITTAMCGFEVGTATGLTAADAGGPTPGVWDTVVGSPAVVTTSARSGSYCLELSSTAAAESVAWNQKTVPLAGTLGSTSDTIRRWTERFHVFLPSLPSGDTVLASVEVGSLANGLVIRYISSSQKLGVKIGTGTEQVSDATVSAGQWVGIDYDYDPRTTTHICDWQVDYDADTDDPTGPVAQARASTSGMTAGGVTTVRKGWTASTTATVRYDDILATWHRKAYPIGDVRIVPLKVDPAGTPTVSGSTSNFNTYTNNGTMAAWNATTARNAIDDIPPTIGASSDGVAQVSVATSDYMQFPMETHTCAPLFVPLAGRWHWAGWAASGNPSNIRFQPDDGGTAFGILGSIDPGYDSSNLVWGTRLHNLNAGLGTFYQLTQARVDALAARIGFSEDANPDAGVHAVLFELAKVPAQVFGVCSAEGEAFKVYVRQDPYSAAVASYLVTTPTGSRGATLTWTISGVDGSQYVGPDTTYEKSIGAETISTVTSVGLTLDPT